MQALPRRTEHLEEGGWRGGVHYVLFRQERTNCRRVPYIRPLSTPLYRQRFVSWYHWPSSSSKLTTHSLRSILHCQGTQTLRESYKTTLMPAKIQAVTSLRLQLLCPRLGWMPPGPSDRLHIYDFFTTTSQIRRLFCFRYICRYIHKLWSDLSDFNAYNRYISE